MPTKWRFCAASSALASLGVAEIGVAAVDDDVARVEQGRQLREHGVDRDAGLDHQDDLPRSRQRGHELRQGRDAGDAGARGRSREIFLGAQGGAVVDDHGKTVAGDIEGEILAHHRQPDQPDVWSLLIHAGDLLLWLTRARRNHSQCGNCTALGTSAQTISGESQAGGR